MIRPLVACLSVKSPGKGPNKWCTWEYGLPLGTYPFAVLFLLYLHNPRSVVPQTVKVTLIADNASVVSSQQSQLFASPTWSENNAKKVENERPVQVLCTK